MSPATSRRMRNADLALVFLGSCAVLLPAAMQARFGHQYDWLLPPWLFFALVLLWWAGIVLYVIGRFRYRPWGLGGPHNETLQRTGSAASSVPVK